MKTIIIGLIVIILAIIAQVTLIGLNGLTIITILMTIYLGFEAIDKSIHPQQKNK